MFTTIINNIAILPSMSHGYHNVEEAKYDSNVSAKAPVQDPNQIYNAPHLMFSDYHYDKVLENVVVLITLQN